MSTNEGHALSREELVRTLTAYTGITTSDGEADGSTLIDSKLIGKNDFLTGKSILILSGDALYETIGISSFNSTTGEITFGGSLSCQIVAGVTFRVLNTLPESVHITSGLITMEGYDYISGVYRKVAVNESGQLEIKAEISDIVQARVSGQRIRIEGYDYISGQWRQVAVDESGQMHIHVTLPDMMRVVLDSGKVAILSGEVHVISGIVTAQVLSGQISISSGMVAVLSGEVHVMSGIVEVASILSGQVQITSGVVAAIVSGTVEAGISGTVVVTSGEVDINQGDITITSGVLDITILSGVVSVSGETIDIAKPTSVLTRDILPVTSDSGGMALESGIIASMTLKSLSGDIFVGGTAEGDMPYSGHGLLLAAGEAWSLDIDDFNKVRVCATVSGDWVSYAGVN